MICQIWTLLLALKDRFDNFFRELPLVREESRPKEKGGSIEVTVDIISKSSPRVCLEH